MSDTGALVYVVDDDPSAREGVVALIRSAGLTAKAFASAEEFLAAPRPEMRSCLVLDVSLPGVSGLDLQQELAEAGVQIPVIFLTGHGDIPMTVRALKAGAANFLTKPFDDEELLNAIRQCITSDEEERLYLESEIRSEHNFDDIVGKSDALHKVLEQIAIVAPTDSTVLLHGETGTGKELIAKAIHNLSSRRDRPFVRINCAAIPSGLLESELFGHEKGAFTGALMQKKGRFELADHGSLFLDEIGDISLELQPKLLRAVQEQEFERLGSAKTIKVDVRIIAATHRDLRAMIREDKFREDLFYRLNVFPIEIPPLRERRGDIPLLVNYFVSKLSRQMGKKIQSIPGQAMEVLAKCLVARQCARAGKLHRARRHSHAGERVECPDCGAEEQDASASHQFRVHISRCRAAGHYRCAQGCFRQDCRRRWGGRTPWPETYDTATQDAPAQHLAGRLVATSR